MPFEACRRKSKGESLQPHYGHSQPQRKSRKRGCERAVQFIKGGFSFRAGRELGMRSPVWQKGFSDRRITGVDEFERIRNYIHKNPVKQLLVKEAPQYPYSSAHYGFELDPAPVYLNPKLIAAVFRAAKSLPDKASRDAFFHAVSKAG